LTSLYIDVAFVTKLLLSYPVISRFLHSNISTST